MEAPQKISNSAPSADDHEDSQWEDAETDAEGMSTRTSPEDSSIITSQRTQPPARTTRRRNARLTLYPRSPSELKSTTPSRSASAPTKRPNKKQGETEHTPTVRPKQQIITTDEILEYGARILRAVTFFIYDTLFLVLSVLYYPLVIISSLVVIVFIGAYLWNVALRSVVCPLPILGRIDACSEPINLNLRSYIPNNLRTANIRPIGAKSTHEYPSPDFPRLMNIQGTTFEKLMEDTYGSRGLSTDIKRTEIAARDLLTLVQASDLSTKDILAEQLQEFVNDAKATSASLMRLHVKVEGAVDEVLAVQDWSLRSIQEARASLPSPNSLLARFHPFAPTPDYVHKKISSTFTSCMDLVSDQLQSLIVLAQLSETNLQSLENKLSIIHSLLGRENLTQSEKKEEVLADLWVQLFNKRERDRKMRSVEGEIELLRDLENYRKRAVAFVAGAVQALSEMQEGMDELRERVKRPVLLGAVDGVSGTAEIRTAYNIPMEAHIEGIQNGLKRLQFGRKKAREVGKEVMDRLMAEEEDKLAKGGWIVTNKLDKVRELPPA